jgi:hypothetical protein
MYRRTLHFSHNQHIIGLEAKQGRWVTLWGRRSLQLRCTEKFLWSRNHPVVVWWRQASTLAECWRLAGCAAQIHTQSILGCNKYGFDSRGYHASGGCLRHNTSGRSVLVFRWCAGINHEKRNAVKVVRENNQQLSINRWSRPSRLDLMERWDFDCSSMIIASFRFWAWFAWSQHGSPPASPKVLHAYGHVDTPPRKTEACPWHGIPGGLSTLHYVAHSTLRHAYELTGSPSLKGEIVFKLIQPPTKRSMPQLKVDKVRGPGEHCDNDGLLPSSQSSTGGCCAQNDFLGAIPNVLCISVCLR